MIIKTIKRKRDGSPKLDSNGNPIPIYKKIKKLLFQYIDENQVMTCQYVKPQWSGIWGVEFQKKFVVLQDVENNIIWFKNKPTIITSFIGDKN